MRRWLIATLLLTVTAVFCFMFYRNTRITNAEWKFSRLEIGMSESQILEIMGPPGDYSGMGHRDTINDDVGQHHLYWRFIEDGKAIGIYVRFGVTRKVIGKGIERTVGT